MRSQRSLDHLWTLTPKSPGLSTANLVQLFFEVGQNLVDCSLTTLYISDIRNQCAVDNGGCSHLCFWSMLTAGYECRCPQSYQLLGDKKTCFPSRKSHAGQMTIVFRAANEDQVGELHASTSRSHMVCQMLPW